MPMVVLKSNNIPAGETRTLADFLRMHGVAAHTVMIRVDGRIVRKEQFETFAVAPGTVVRAYPFVGGG